MLMAGEKLNWEDTLGQSIVVPSLPDPVSEMCMILVNPPQEQLARDSLRRRGIGVWWPNYQRIETKKDQQTGKRYQRIVRAGVLPGVILSTSMIGARFFDALDLAPGVIGVAQKPNGHWLLLTDLDIVLIHKIEHGLNRPPTLKPVHSFKPHDKVRFVDDIYRRMAGVVARCRRDGHIDVEVNMMGRLQPLTVLPDQIELA
jgi:transcription antitermination factor NusG